VSRSDTTVFPVDTQILSFWAIFDKEFESSILLVYNGHVFLYWQWCMFILVLDTVAIQITGSISNDFTVFTHIPHERKTKFV
jgi:hypothetical protein